MDYTLIQTKLVGADWGMKFSSEKNKTAWFSTQKTTFLEYIYCRPKYIYIGTQLYVPCFFIILILNFIMAV